MADEGGSRHRDMFGASGFGDTSGFGGIDVTLQNCIQSPPFSGQSVNLTKGDHHLDGKQALAFARVRKNHCAPREYDRQRAARQQQVLSAIRSRIVSPVLTSV